MKLIVAVLSFLTITLFTSDSFARGGSARRDAEERARINAMAATRAAIPASAFEEAENAAQRNTLETTGEWFASSNGLRIRLNTDRYRVVQRGRSHYTEKRENYQTTYEYIELTWSGKILAISKRTWGGKNDDLFIGRWQ